MLKSNNEKEQKNRELELAALKAKIRKLELSAGGGVKRELEIKQFQENLESKCLDILENKNILSLYFQS